MVCYEMYIVEEYEDCAPEPFGYQLFDTPPKIGDIITLKWLDGRVAYDVEVIHVMQNAELRVRRNNHAASI